MFWTGRERSLRAWVQLMVGLFGYGLAVSLMIASHLGLGPWDAFHVGLHNLTGMSVGVASIVAGLVLLIGTWFIGVRPGPGTIANMIMIGVFIDLILPWLPPATTWLWGLVYHVSGILICGLSTGFYIGAGLGKGPRDGLMIGLSQRAGWSVGRVRTLIELVVLVLGVLMGGTIGIGTLLFALGIGPAAQWGMRVCGALEERPVPYRYATADERR
jgi:uncharacterized membrane protein YczE